MKREKKCIHDSIAKSEKLYCSYIDTPLGLLELTADEYNLVGIMFRDSKIYDFPENKITIEAAKQFSEYFLGKRKEFSLPIKFNGTPFQNRVWKELMNIPYGETISYKELAERIGNPKGCRAVGGANGKNIVNIIAPCHRVIGSNNKLTGYGGGLDKKQWLLDHEKKFSKK